MYKSFSVLLTLCLLCLLCCFEAAVLAAEKEPAKDAKVADKNGKSTIEHYTGPKERVGVMEMEVKVASQVIEPTASGGVIATTTVSIPPPMDFGSGLSEMLTTALVDTGRFIVLERKALTDIQNELLLAAAGATDPTASPQGGKLLGAQVLIRGAVTEYTYNRTNSSGSSSFLKGIGVSASKAEAAVVLDIRLYEVETGQIIDSVKAEGRAKSSGKAVDIDKSGVQMSASSFKQTPLGNATRQAIESAVELIIERMEEIPWEGRIADIEVSEGGRLPTLYLNAGKRVGLQEGDAFEIWRPGRPITDPETRVVIGRTKDKRLGACVIETLMPDLSIAAPTEGTGFEIGDIVRMSSCGKEKTAAPPVEAK